MTIAERIADRARQEGLELYFGLPGSGALMDLMEAGRHVGLDLVLMGHESSAAITAAYYGHLRGGAGLAIGIKGAGAGNLAAGAVNAFFERMPVVCLCERIGAGAPRRHVAGVRTGAAVRRGVERHSPDRRGRRCGPHHRCRLRRGHGRTSGAGAAAVAFRPSAGRCGQRTHRSRRAAAERTGAGRRGDRPGRASGRRLAAAGRHPGAGHRDRRRFGRGPRADRPHAAGGAARLPRARLGDRGRCPLRRRVHGVSGAEHPGQPHPGRGGRRAADRRRRPVRRGDVGHRAGNPHLRACGAARLRDRVRRQPCASTATWPPPSRP